MTEKIYFDTVTFVYALENKNTNMLKIFSDAIINSDVVTSVLSIMEFSVGCYKRNMPEDLTNLIDFLKDNCFEIIEINTEIALKAGEIRANNPHFKAMDSLHLATAVVSGATVFYTNDKQLMQFKYSNIEVRLVD